MQIMFVAPGLNTNRGGERVIFAYAKALAKKHDVSIFVPEGTVFMRDESVKIIEYKSLFSPFWSRQLGYIDVLGKVKQIPSTIDVIIGTYLPQMILPVLYKLSHPKVKFLMFNQDFSAMFKNRPLRQLMFKIYPKFTDERISISTFCADELEKASGVKSVIIQNGLENEFKPDGNRFERKNYILWIGSRNKHKGFIDFWKAMKIVWKKHPEIRLITTEGAFKSNPSSEIIRINGDKALLKKLYKEALMFVCSSHSEGFGLPALEAMGCGCPVVTTDTGGSREYAENEFNSLVVPAKAPAALADAMSRIIENPDLRERLSDNGENTAKSFDWDVAYRKMTDFVESTVVEK